MFYIDTLYNDTECEMKTLDGKKHSQLKEAAPEFFNHTEKAYGVHVIILCSECNSDWNCHSFQGQFQQPNAFNTELPLTPEKSSVDRNFCISSSKKPETILEAIVEIAQFVKRIYSQDFGIDAIATNLMLSKEQSWNVNQAKHMSEKLSDGIKTGDEQFAHQKVFLLLTMPRNCFEDFKSHSIPSFIEYVVKEQPFDPDIEVIKQEKQDLEVKADRMREKYIELRDEVLGFLEDTTNRLKILSDDLKKEPEHNNTIPVQNNVDSLLDSISRTKNRVDELKL